MLFEDASSASHTHRADMVYCFVYSEISRAMEQREDAMMSYDAFVATLREIFLSHPVMASCGHGLRNESEARRL